MKIHRCVPTHPWKYSVIVEVSQLIRGKRDGLNL